MLWAFLLSQINVRISFFGLFPPSLLCFYGIERSIRFAMQDIKLCVPIPSPGDLNFFQFFGKKFCPFKNFLLLRRRDGRAIECGGLENRCGETHRGFESPSLRFFLSIFPSKSDNFFYFKEKFCPFKNFLLLRRRRDGRAVECGGLENRCGLTHRGFESPSLRFFFYLHYVNHPMVQNIGGFIP